MGLLLCACRNRIVKDQLAVVKLAGCAMTNWRIFSGKVRRGLAHPKIFEVIRSRLTYLSTYPFSRHGSQGKIKLARIIRRSSSRRRRRADHETTVAFTRIAGLTYYRFRSNQR